MDRSVPKLYSNISMTALLIFVSTDKEKSGFFVLFAIFRFRHVIRLFETIISAIPGLISHRESRKFCLFRFRTWFLSQAAIFVIETSFRT